jgi:hypothetical protein
MHRDRSPAPGGFLHRSTERPRGRRRVSTRVETIRNFVGKPAAGSGLARLSVVAEFERSCQVPIFRGPPFRVQSRRETCHSSLARLDRRHRVHFVRGLRNPYRRCVVDLLGGGWKTDTLIFPGGIISGIVCCWFGHRLVFRGHSVVSRRSVKLVPTAQAPPLISNSATTRLS